MTNPEPVPPTLAPPTPVELALLLVFALPAALGLGLWFANGSWWFNDLDAMLCGAWRSAHHASPYAQQVSCPGGRPAPYMYLPQLAWLLAPLAQGSSISGLRLVAGAAELAAAAILFFILFLRGIEGAPRILRGPALALVSGGAIASANLAFPLHALVAGCGLSRRRGSWLLIPAIVAASVIKPVLLTYLLILAYEPDPLAVRARRLGAGLLLAAVAGGIVVATGGPELLVWKAALDHQVLEQEIGHGFLSWAAHLGLAAHGLPILAAYGAFAGLACMGGLAIAEVRGLGRDARVFLALGVAQVVNPRLMSYDLMMLAPLAVAYAAVPETSRRVFQWAAVGVGVFVFVLHLVGRSPLAIDLGPALLILIFFAAAALAVADLGRKCAANARR